MKLKDNYGYKKTVKSIVEYIITNRLFISYVVLSLIATICVRAFTIGSALKLKPLLTDLGFILVIGGLGYLVKPKNQFKYYFTWLIIFNVMCLISSIYYRFFTSFASIGELATVRQTETVTGSIFDRLRIADGIYILIPIIFYLIHKKLLSSSYYTFIDKIEKSKKTGKIRHIYDGKTLIVNMRASDSFLILSKEGAKRLHAATQYPKNRVVVNKDSEPFSLEGKSVFAKFVVECDEDIRAKDEVLIVNEEDKLLAYGKALLGPCEINDFQTGQAIKTRKGMKK